VSYSVPAFSVDEQSLDETTRLLTVRGELDAATAPVLGQRIRRAVFWTEVTRAVVDLTEVTFVDSSGVTTLILSHGHAKALGRRVLFVCPDGSVLRRVKAYGLESELPLYDTREQALAA
jgi:anti-anti-sigma factor